jgi:D-alanyl-D-alanine dipeptidase
MQSLRDKPLPDDIARPFPMSRHEVQLDPASKLASEPLVDLSGFGIACESYYARTDGLNAPYYRAIVGAPQTVHAREGVGRRLETVNEALAPAGLELLVWDGYRPLGVQIALWEFFLGEAARVLGADAPEADRIEFTRTYCSDPRGFDPGDHRTWPLHLTGGSVDLTLRRKGGEPLFMGGVFDDPAPLSHTAFFEPGAVASEPLSHAEARANRRLLFWAMEDAGFVNFHAEWWHFDFGGQLWAVGEAARKARPAKCLYPPVLEAPA